jgi:two-component system, NarL family, invasion response regulator UvrY
MPSILIGEELAIIRIGIIQLIHTLHPLAVIAEADHFDGVLKKLVEANFDMLLLDADMSGANNLQIVQAVKIRRPEIPVLIFSTHDELMYARRYLHAGALGYLQKKSSPEEIIKAIQKILRNERYISTQVRDQLIGQWLFVGEQQGELSNLSNREVEVMHLMIRGASASEIKTALHIQDSTVSTYKAKIFEKMKVTNIIELAEKIKLLEGK